MGRTAMEMLNDIPGDLLRSQRQLAATLAQLKAVLGEDDLNGLYTCVAPSGETLRYCRHCNAWIRDKYDGLCHAGYCKGRRARQYIKEKEVSQ